MMSVSRPLLNCKKHLGGKTWQFGKWIFLVYNKSINGEIEAAWCEFKKNSARLFLLFC